MYARPVTHPDVGELCSAARKLHKIRHPFDEVVVHSDVRTWVDRVRNESWWRPRRREVYASQILPLTVEVV